MQDVRRRLGDFAAQAVSQAKETGLRWDEVVAAFGLAAKALAVEAADHGDGSLLGCVDHARLRFEQGLAQPANVEIAAPSHH